MKNRIYIVMPVFNRLEFTKKCVASIYKQNYQNFQLILIDDGSTDGTSNFIKSKYPKTRIIYGNGNWWWTRSMYEGVKESLKTSQSGDYILEMNNDLYFGKNYFSELVKYARKHKSSLIGSMCVRAQKPSEVVEAGIRIDWPTGHVYGVAQTVSTKLSYYKNMDIIENLDALPGKGTLIPVEVFKKIGNFNYKKLPHYIADYEFANRAKNHGYNLIVDPKAIAKHFWEATGISSKRNRKTRSFNKAFALLFGRKSMNNIIDWVNFIFLACPNEYKLRNLYFSFWKVIRAIFTVYPFFYAKPYLNYLPLFIHRTKIKIIQFPKFYKLIFYRLYIKIKQFPKYHLK